MNLAHLYKEHLEHTPGKPAVICDHDSLTYTDLDKNAADFRSVLLSLNVQEGDRVSFLTGNTLFLPPAYMGCFQSGAVAVPSSYFSSEKELIYESNHCQTSIYFVSKECYPKLKALKKKCPSLRHIVVIDGKADQGDLCYPDLTRADNRVPDSIEIAPLAPAMILYTSGSTGKPKGVTHTHRSLYATAKNRAQSIRHDTDNVMMTTSYMSHAAANAIVLFPMLYAGGTALFTSVHDMVHIMNLVNTYQVTHMAASPMEWQKIIQPQGDEVKKFSSLRFAVSGGSAVSQDLQENIKKQIGIPLTIGLGMTECSGYMTTPPHMPFKAGSLGLPIQGVKIKLINDEGTDVPENITGEILVKTDMMMSGYYNDPENTKNSFTDGWYKSGDLAFKDNDGYFYFNGRKKNIIIRNGGNISPGEVEDAILQHPDIKDAIVMGVKDEIQGQTVLAAMVPESSNRLPSENDMASFLKGRIADRKIPEYWLFMKSFPRDTTLKKVNMKEINRLAQDHVKKIKG